MNTQDNPINVEALVNSVAKKYKKKFPHLLEDIKQEGWVAALSYIDKRSENGKEITPMGVKGSIMKAVFRFCNLKQFPVSVPVNSTTVESFKRGEIFQDVYSCELLEQTVIDGSGFIQEFKGDEKVVRDLVEVVLQGQLKDVIVKRYFEGKSLREVAKELDMSPTTVYNREQSALIVLHNHI